METQGMFSRRRFLAHSAGAAALALGLQALLRVSPAGATAGEFYAVATQGLRLRSGPGLRFGVLASLSKGTNVEYLAWGGMADGYDWARVRVISSGKTGFVAYTFLTSIPSDGLPLAKRSMSRPVAVWAISVAVRNGLPGDQAGRDGHDRDGQGRSGRGERILLVSGELRHGDGMDGVGGTGGRRGPQLERLAEWLTHTYHRHRTSFVRLRSLVRPFTMAAGYRRRSKLRNRTNCNHFAIRCRRRANAAQRLRVPQIRQGGTVFARRHAAGRKRLHLGQCAVR